SFREARAATEFRHIFGKNQVLTIADTGMPLGGELLDSTEYQEALRLKIKLGLDDEALGILNEIEKRLSQGQFIALSAVQLIGMQLAIGALQEAQFGESDPVGQNRFFFERCRPIQEGETVQEIFGALRALVTEITSQINWKRESLQESVIGKAMQYIENNYCREGLSLTDVAQVVHVSPVYLSIMFKKEKNINFSDYLTELRMKRAMELLRNSDLKTYEVAERIGYSNPQYFSVCFKKYCGASPSDFKKQ
ncbi:MAG TPA: helix-turn-helix domain-containing protein, partial [Bacillota bacterium]|nr:helix-turn-helix domain-containing protein [Bacillota bacterium]